MVEMKPSRRRVETVHVLGLPLISTVTEEFDIQTYPKKVQRDLKRSAVPQELQADALAVLGRAYGRVMTTWSSDKVGDTPDLAWRVPTPDDFSLCVEQLRGNVEVDQIVELSRRLFERSDTPQELLSSIENEIQLIFNPPEKDR